MDQLTNKYKYISSATTTTFGAQPTGVLHSVVVGETSAGSITISDAVGTIAVLKASIAEGTYVFDVAYTKNLVVVTTGASKITVNYK
jgi:hypothetical protein